MNNSDKKRAGGKDATATLEQERPRNSDAKKDKDDMPQNKNPGNFANDVERAREAGRKGGRA